MKDFRTRAVIVFVDSTKGAFSKMPRPVQAALSSPEMGPLIPRMAVLDGKAEKLIGQLSYKQLHERREVNKLRKAIRAHVEDGGTSGTTEQSSGSAGDSETAAGSAESADAATVSPDDGILSGTKVEAWTSSTGSTLLARAHSFADGRLTLVKKSGRTIVVTVDQLSEESRKRLAELTGETLP